MQGYHLRSRSIPVEEVQTLGDVLSTSASHATIEGAVEGLVSEGQSQVSAELAGTLDLPGGGPIWKRLFQTEVGLP